MAIINPSLWTTTLNINWLNSPIKKNRVAERIKNLDPTVCCLQETHFKFKNIHRLKVKRWKKIIHVNGNQNMIAILISDKVDLKSKTVSIDKEGHWIMIQASTQQEDTTITNT